MYSHDAISHCCSWLFKFRFLKAVIQLAVGMWPEQKLFALPEPINRQHLITCGGEE